MADVTYEKDITGLVVIDPYNDFISEGGKVWDRLKGVAEANECVPHMLDVLNAARRAGIRVFYALHHRYRPGDYETWKYIAPIQRAAWSRKTFEYGTWGGELRSGFEPQPGDVVAQEHWCSSGFANTDLDLQLKKHGIQRLIVRGTHRTHLRRGNRSIRRRAWLRGHDGEGRDGRLLGRGDARRSRHQHSELRDSRGDDR
jgi:nicotinamidase-related amidase